jgi:hypothetical protein
MTWLAGIASSFHAEGFKSYWSQRKFMFSEVLQDWVEEIMSKPLERRDYALLGLGKKSDTVKG